MRKLYLHIKRIIYEYRIILYNIIVFFSVIYKVFSLMEKGEFVLNEFENSLLIKQEKMIIKLSNLAKKLEIINNELGVK